MAVLSVPRPELRILLADVKAQPDDDVPRLILGDWLQDQGDPRGELIHLQVVRARLSDDDPRWIELRRCEAALLRRHVHEWLGPLVDLAAGWEFERGFIRLTARAERFLVPEVFELAGEGGLFDWVEELALSDVRPEHVTRLSGSPLLGQLVCLDLSNARLGDDGAIRLHKAPGLANLRTLRLGGNRIGRVGGAKLAGCPFLAKLRVLDLRNNRLGAVGATRLAASPYLAGLARLDLRGNGLDQAALTALRATFGDRVVVGQATADGA
jgi:uncharacterized protein (TIGR02996 family)